MANNKSTTGRNKKNSNPKKLRKEPVSIDRGTASVSINRGEVPLAQQHLGIEEEIRRRAYELYEQRGRQEGFHDQDWVRAETEILSRYNRKETA